jgi:Sec1 family
MVLDMITRFKREGEADAGGPSSGDASATTSSTPEAEIDTLILLDRGVDVVSPLVTPLTFEALLDQVFHIETGMCSSEVGVGLL